MCQRRGPVHGCHPEWSEGSLARPEPILRSTQDDNGTSYEWISERTGKEVRQHHHIKLRLRKEVHCKLYYAKGNRVRVEQGVKHDKIRPFTPVTFAEERVRSGY